MAEPSRNRPTLREQFYTIKAGPVRDVPVQQRPREVFDRVGPAEVTDQQLLAILLRSGKQGLSVLDIADGLMKNYGNLQTLAQTSASDLAGVPGLGKVKAQALLAAFELGRRAAQSPDPNQQPVRTPDDAASLLRHAAKTKEVESFWILMLDTKYRLRRPPLEITRGIIDASLVHPREVFKEAIRAACAAVVLVHNHPSGDPTPSAEDIRITRQLVEAGKLLEIEVLDHVVLGRQTDNDHKGYVSLRESGLVDFSN